MNMEKLLNDLVAKLMSEGSAEFSQSGLNVKTTYDNGQLKILASFVNPEEDKTKELVEKFNSFVQSLDETFFMNVTNSFAEGELKRIETRLDSKNPAEVRAGITDFMTRVKKVASETIAEINKDIAEVQKDLADLIEIRDSYIQVLNKKF